MNLMADTKRNKSYEVSKEGFITVYPSLHEQREKVYSGVSLRG
jgi:hypothetical protein